MALFGGGACCRIAVPYSGALRLYFFSCPTVLHHEQPVFYTFQSELWYSLICPSKLINMERELLFQKMAIRYNTMRHGRRVL